MAGFIDQLRALLMPGAPTDTTRTAEELALDEIRRREGIVGGSPTMTEFGRRGRAALGLRAGGPPPSGLQAVNQRVMEALSARDRAASGADSARAAQTPAESPGFIDRLRGSLGGFFGGGDRGQMERRTTPLFAENIAAVVRAIRGLGGGGDDKKQVRPAKSRESSARPTRIP